MDNIYLVGFMGTGKTAVGRELALRLNRRFTDIDDVITEKEKRSINQIFAEDGEGHFRKIEKETLKALAGQSRLIVSCGGGIVIEEENIKLMKETGTMVALSAAAEVILKRTRNDSSRPLLNTSDPLGKIKELLEKRKEFYLKANFTVDTSDLLVKDVADRIMGLLS